MTELFSARNMVLVHEDLFEAATALLSGSIEVMAFRGDRIGPANESGAALSLADLGMPTGVRAILDLKPGHFAGSWRALSAAARQPRMPKVLVLDRSAQDGASRDLIAQSIAQTLGAALADTEQVLLEREREVIALRQLLERRSLRLERLAATLGQMGLSEDELAFDTFLSEEGVPVPLPARQHVGMALRNLAAISVYRSSAQSAPIAVVLSAGGRQLYSHVVPAGESGGWQHIVLPEALLTEVADAQIAFSSLEGQAALLGSRTSEHVYLRLWWHRSAGGESAPGARRLLPALGEGSQNSIEALLPSAGRQSSGHLDTAYAVLNGQGDMPDHLVIRGVLLRPGQAVRQAVAARAGNEASATCALLLVPHGRTLTSSDAAAVLGGETLPGTVAKIAQLQPGERAVLEAAFDGVSPARVDVVLLMQAPAETNGEASIALEHPEITGPERPTLAFSSATFTSLHNLVAFCDGPAEEMMLSRELGYACVVVADGDSFLQTHPVAGRVVGARLPHLIPAGTERLWLNLSNEHPAASPTEFIAAIVPKMLETKAEAWLDGLDLPAYEAMSVTDLGDGSCISRVTLGPASRHTMDLTLPGPTGFSGHLYLLVRGLGDTVSYGWCRWHHITVGFDSALPPTRLG